MAWSTIKKEKDMANIRKEDLHADNHQDMTIAQVLRLKLPIPIKVFMEVGMHCFGCAVANKETVAEAAVVAHGVDVNKLLADPIRTIKPQ